MQVLDQVPPAAMSPLPLASAPTAPAVSPKVSPAVAPARDAARYTLRLADSPADLAAAQRLRFEVFNIELGEGLLRSYADGLDSDRFDAVCDHLLVLDAVSGQVVGTYRLQPGLRALEAHGYYSAREFDFRPFEPLRARLVELGRACVHEQHRSFAVLNLLWRGIAEYARRHQARYLVGCSSLTSRDARHGALAWQQLQTHLAEPALRTQPQPGLACGEGSASEGGTGAAPEIPRLLLAYLALGAKLCGPPAIDREFGTVDFLTCLDLESPDPVQRRRLERYVGRPPS